jgi:hypothetical protein
MADWRAGAALLVLLCGCSAGTDSSSAGGECDEAWQVADEVAHLSGQAKVLHPAFSACTSFDEFQSASTRYPGVLDGVDPARYVDNQCHFRTLLMETPVCRTLPPHDEP